MIIVEKMYMRIGFIWRGKCVAEGHRKDHQKAQKIEKGQFIPILDSQFPSFILDLGLLLTNVMTYAVCLTSGMISLVTIKLAQLEG